jgi:hypothetical protein
MKPVLQPSRVALLMLLSAAVLACSREPAPVSFTGQVKPLLDTHCVECHMPGQAGYESSGLRLDSYEALMKGTKFGPIVIPGDALSSALTMLIEGRADPSIEMPHGKAPLSAQDQKTIRTWVEQGAANN